MLPVDVLQVVLLLLQLEDVTHKELLQVFVGKVDAQLLEAEQTDGKNESIIRLSRVATSTLLIH